MKLTSLVCFSILALVHASSRAVGVSGLRPERILEDNVFYNGYSNDAISGTTHDFQWDLEASSPFVEASRNSTADAPTMVFHFDTGFSAKPYKRFRTSLFNPDCTTVAIAATALEAVFDNTDPTILSVSVNIDMDKISSSSYFQASADSAKISFCLVVEYNYFSPDRPRKELTMNFLNTGVVATVGLEEDFSVSNIQTAVSHNEVQTELDYDYTVIAELCDGRDPPIYDQGSLMELCVYTPAGAPYDIESVKNLILSQEGSGSIAVRLISDHEDSHFARSDCTSGACRILIQIPVIFHRAEPLTTLALDGTALLSFPGNRRLDAGEGLPEQSTGFRATVVVMYPEDEDDASGTPGFSVTPMFALLACAVVGVSSFLF